MAQAMTAFDRMTPRTHYAFRVAFQMTANEARWEVETKHLVVGVVFGSDSGAIHLLEACGLSRHLVRHEALLRIQPVDREERSDRQAGQEMRLSPSLKAAIESAVMAAGRLGHADIGTGHLLLGLAQAQDELLVRLGVNPEAVRGQLEGTGNPLAEFKGEFNLGTREN